jgi:hypothetical protein
MSLTPDEMKRLFRRTVVVQKPTYGIISGYHELPYVCLGPNYDSDTGTLRIKGKIQVSPRFVIRPDHLMPNYAEIFGTENVDFEIAGRVFGVLGFPQRPVECKSENLEVTKLDGSVDEVLSKTLEELERREDIATGVILTPNTRYYPISIERFISTILDDEFNVGR